MIVRITHETDTDCGLVEIMQALQDSGFEEALGTASYGDGIKSFCLSVRCLPHSFQRQNPKMLNGTIYVPVDMDYQEFMAMPESQRKKALGTRINDKTRQALARLPVPATFDAVRFAADHKAFLQRKGWL